MSDLTATYPAHCGVVHFVDIDGVLICGNRHTDWACTPEKCVSCLREFVNDIDDLESGCVVFSSDRRRRWADVEHAMQEEGGFLQPLRQYLHLDWRTPFFDQNKRESEIIHWLTWHYREVDEFVIWDDRPDLYSSLAGCVVECHNRMGISQHSTYVHMREFRRARKNSAGWLASADGVMRASLAREWSAGGLDRALAALKKILETAPVDEQVSAFKRAGVPWCDLDTAAVFTGLKEGADSSL